MRLVAVRGLGRLGEKVAGHLGRGRPGYNKFSVTVLQKLRPADAEAVSSPAGFFVQRCLRES